MRWWKGRRVSSDFVKGNGIFFVFVSIVIFKMLWVVLLWDRGLIWEGVY